MENHYRSEEEKMFAKWLDFLVQYGIIEPIWNYEPYQMQLIKPVKYKNTHNGKIQSLLQGLKYTYDFDFTFKEKYKDHEICALFKKPNDLRIYVDVKGGYTAGYSQQKFGVISKIVYEQTGMFVQKIEIPKFFKKSFHPTLTRSKVHVLAIDYFENWQDKLF